MPIEYQFIGISFSREKALTPNGFNLVVERYFGDVDLPIQVRKQRFTVSCDSNPFEIERPCNDELLVPPRLADSSVQIIEQETQMSSDAPSSHKDSGYEVDTITDSGLCNLNLSLVNDTSFLVNCCMQFDSDLSHFLSSTIKPSTHIDQRIPQFTNFLLGGTSPPIEYGVDPKMVSGQANETILPIEIMKFVLASEECPNLNEPSLSTIKSDPIPLNQESIVILDDTIGPKISDGHISSPVLAVGCQLNQPGSTSEQLPASALMKSDVSSTVLNRCDQPESKDHAISNFIDGDLSKRKSMKQDLGASLQSNDDSEISLDWDSYPTSTDVSSSDYEIMASEQPDTVTSSKYHTLSPRHAGNVNGQDLMSDDPYVTLATKIHVLRLPDSMVYGVRASKLDKIYTRLNEDLFRSEIRFHHRYSPKCELNDSEESFQLNLMFNASLDNHKWNGDFLNVDSDDSRLDHPDEEIESPEPVEILCGRKRKIIMDSSNESIGDDLTIGNVSDSNDEDSTENEETITDSIKFSSSFDDDSDVDGDGDGDGKNQEIDDNKIEKSEEKEAEVIAMTSNREEITKIVTEKTSYPAAEDESEKVELKSKSKSKRKNIKRVLTEEELEMETKEATCKERKRMEKIVEQEILYDLILPEINKTRNEPSLFLDINSETKEIRVEVDGVLMKELKPHQLNGIRFMYNCIIGSVDQLNEPRSGCILAHCMGLGKTLQVITLVHTLLTNRWTKNYIRTILIVVPVNTLKNWADEFDKWITRKGLKTFKVHEIVNDVSMKNRLDRLSIWKRVGGVLIIGQKLLSNLLNLSSESRLNIDQSTIKEIDRLLVEPGPDIMVIDEGHQLKSATTELCVAVSRIPTERKIILTGTPLQNNLVEYFNMVSIVKPRLLGSIKEFMNRFVNPIQNGQQADSNEDDVKLMKQRATVLHQLLAGCIQRFDAETLKPFLQEKLEYALFIRPSKRSAEMYNFYLDNIKTRTPIEHTNPLRAFCNHPVIHLVEREKEVAKKEVLRSKKVKQSSQPITLMNGQLTKTDDEGKSDEENGTDKEANDHPNPEETLLKKDWYKQFVQPSEWQDIELSCKLVLFFKILKKCIALGDKLVVVSQSLETLNLIEKCLQLNRHVEIDTSMVQIKWRLNRNFFRIDGSILANNRLDQIKKFNDPKNTEARLFLLSTKAGGVGINLIGANRCIVFDVSWNPSVDTQAIFRIFRLGQSKPVYVYRFVSKDTMEEKIFRKQIVKLGIAIQVVDKHQIKRSFKAAELAEFYGTRPKTEYQISLHDVPQDCLLADILHEDNKEVVEFIAFDSLLEKNPEEELTEDERRAAWLEYQKDRDAEFRAAEDLRKALKAEEKKKDENQTKVEATKQSEDVPKIQVKPSVQKPLPVQTEEGNSSKTDVSSILQVSDLTTISAQNKSSAKTKTTKLAPDSMVSTIAETLKPKRMLSATTELEASSNCTKLLPNTKDSIDPQPERLITDSSKTNFNQINPKQIETVTSNPDALSLGINLEDGNLEPTRKSSRLSSLKPNKKAKEHQSKRSERGLKTKETIGDVNSGSNQTSSSESDSKAPPKQTESEESIPQRDPNTNSLADPIDPLASRIGSSKPNSQLNGQTTSRVLSISEPLASVSSKSKSKTSKVTLSSSQTPAKDGKTNDCASYSKMHSGRKNSSDKIQVSQKTDLPAIPESPSNSVKKTSSQTNPVACPPEVITKVKKAIETSTKRHSETKKVNQSEAPAKTSSSRSTNKSPKTMIPTLTDEHSKLHPSPTESVQKPSSRVTKISEPSKYLSNKEPRKSTSVFSVSSSSSIFSLLPESIVQRSSSRLSAKRFTTRSAKTSKSEASPSSSNVSKLKLTPEAQSKLPVPLEDTEMTTKSSQPNASRASMMPSVPAPKLGVGSSISPEVYLTPKVKTNTKQQTKSTHKNATKSRRQKTATTRAEDDEEVMRTTQTKVSQRGRRLTKNRKF